MGYGYTIDALAKAEQSYTSERFRIRYLRCVSVASAMLIGLAEQHWIGRAQQLRPLVKLQSQLADQTGTPDLPLFEHARSTMAAATRAGAVDEGDGMSVVRGINEAGDSLSLPHKPDSVRECRRAARNWNQIPVTRARLEYWYVDPPPLIPERK